MYFVCGIYVFVCYFFSFVLNCRFEVVYFYWIPRRFEATGLGSTLLRSFLFYFIFLFSSIAFFFWFGFVVLFFIEAEAFFCFFFVALLSRSSLDFLSLFYFVFFPSNSFRRWDRAVERSLRSSHAIEMFFFPYRVVPNFN